MLKFAKTNRTDRRSGSSIETYKIEDGKKIVYRKVSQDLLSVKSDNDDSPILLCSIGNYYDNIKDDKRSIHSQCSFSDTSKFSTKFSENKIPSTSSDIGEYIRNCSQNKLCLRSTVESSIPEQEESINCLDNIGNVDVNHNVIISDIHLHKNKKKDTYRKYHSYNKYNTYDKNGSVGKYNTFDKYSRSKDVFIVNKGRHHLTPLSSSDDISKSKLFFITSHTRKDLTSVDVNENFSQPMLSKSLCNQQGSGESVPIRRRFITQPLAASPPTLSQKQQQPKINHSKFHSVSSQEDIISMDGRRSATEMRDLEINRMEQTTKTGFSRLGYSQSFRRFDESRQNIRKSSKVSLTSLKRDQKNSRRNSRDDVIDAASISRLSSPSPDSVFSFPKSERSLTDSDRSFSGDSDKDQDANNSNNVKLDANEFNFDDKRYLTPLRRKHSPLSSVDSQYYGSTSSLSSTGLQSNTDITFLSSGLLVKIFSFLDTKDICRISQVCKNWYDIHMTPRLWERICITNANCLEIDRIIDMLLQRLSYRMTHASLCVKHIRLGGCTRLTNDGLKTIALRCPELQSLEITSCYNVTAKGLYDVLINCPNLTHINAAKCEGIVNFSGELSENELMLLENTTFNSIMFLDFSCCSSLTDDGLKRLLLCTAKLQYLYLRQCDCLSNEGLETIASYCKELKEISLNDCFNITDTGISTLVRSCVNLQYISIAKCPISDCTIQDIATNALYLRHLNLHGCEYITDVSIMRIANSCPRIRSLDIGNCAKITDSALYGLSRCQMLRRLNLKGCDKVTDAGLRKVATHCLNLKHLNIRQCNFSSETLLYIKCHCSSCDIEHNVIHVPIIL